MITTATRTKEPPVDQDNPWKHVINFYFRDFLEYCLPDIAQHINWAKGHEFLDKELQKISHTAEIGTRIADKLIKLWEKTGQEMWILCHLDVQGRRERVFPERMLVYRYRTRDTYHKPVISIALLIDPNTKWRPDRYKESCHGSSLEIRYHVIKLIDYQSKRQELERMDNPFAMVILAQLAALEFRKDSYQRLYAKTALTRMLYTKGWDKERILQLYTLIDWLIALPKELMLQYEHDVKHIEEEHQVNYVTTAERIGIEIGMQQGIQEGIQLGLHAGEAALLQRQLKCRFKTIPDYYLAMIEQANNETLLAWGERVLTAATLEEVFV